MKKNYILYALFCLLLSFSGYSQVNVGSGTLTGQALPIEPYYGYSYTQSIYDSSTINAFGSITGVNYYATPQTTLVNSSGWVIYAALTEKTVFDGDQDWIPISEFTQVFEGTPSIEEGLVTITFDVPFEYDGTSNLVLAVEENQDNYDSSTHDFYNTEAQESVSIRYYSDTFNPDPESPPGGFLVNSFPNITFNGITQSCANPNVSVDSVMATSVSLSWFAPDVDNFEYVLQAPGLDDPESGTLISETTLSLTDLVQGDSFEFFIRSVCGDETSSWMSVAFTTPPQGTTGDDPIVIESLPYTTTDDTSLYGDDYENTAEGCEGSTGSYMGGDDVVYVYTATSTGNINVTLSPDLNWAGIYVFNAAADIGVNCWIAFMGLGSDNNPESLELAVEEGSSYYILVSTYPSPQSTTYVLEVEELNCAAPTSLSLNNVTATTAEISWEAGDNTSWEYVLSDQNVEPEGNGTTIDASTISLDNLGNGTPYTFWVRAICGAETYSTWASLTFLNDCVTPAITSWTMSQNGASFDGTNNDLVAGYQIEYSLQPFEPGDGTATIFEFESFPAELTGLEMSTTYYFTIRSMCSDDYYSVWSDNGNDGPDVWSTTGLTCEPSLNCTVGDGFGGLVFGDIDNSDSGCSGNGFGNFTDLTTDLALGETYDVTMTTGYGNQYVRAWIDFNDDYIYTADELVIDNFILGEGQGSGSYTDTTQFMIPADAPLGPHYIRFKANWNAGVPDDPCEPTSYGETEEYTVNIVDALGISDIDLLNLRIYPNPVDGNTVTILSSVSGDKFVEVFDINGRKVISTTIFNDDLDVSNLVSGFYTTRVTIAGKTSVSKLIVK